MKTKNKRKIDISYETKTSEGEHITKGYFEKIYLIDGETNDDLIKKIENKIRPSNYPTTYRITEVPI